MLTLIGAALLISMMWLGTGILIGVLVYVFTERDPEDITGGRMILQSIMMMTWGALGILVILKFLEVI